jgi:hypothetical protein
MYIGYNNLSQFSPRSVPGGICFYTAGMKADLFVTSDESYTAEINKITYTFKRRNYPE